MFSHVTIGTNDLPSATNFYGRLLTPLGITLLALKHNPERALFTQSTTDSGTAFCIYSPLNGERATPGNGSMVAFEAQTRAQVDAFYAIAMANGASDEGAPGLRPQYSPDYYGAYIRDLDGNKICCVCHSAN
ncbi:VOC family protein [Pseudomonas piscis]|uniref:VOC family protein n=1 Tax=Pseudomonas piscis TaxID=2614538 RepID=UPI000A10A207|nr:VOC family protein [Pseudomonas piscis]